MKTLLILIALAMVFLIGASGCTQTQTIENNTQIQQTGNIVYLKNFSFQPSEITINRGESVTWLNQDSVVHTASADDLSWSLKMVQGQNFSKTFDKTGEYPYHCAIHPSMKGRVIVT